MACMLYVQNCPVFLVCPASQYLATCWQKYPVRLRQTLRKKADACACSVYPALSPPLKGPGDEANSPHSSATGPNPTDLRNPINELGLQLPTEMGGELKGQRSHRTWEWPSFRTHPLRDRPHTAFATDSRKP